MAKGILALSKSDYDGWPVGDPHTYVGPFESHEEGIKWFRKKYGYSQTHCGWYSLTNPEGE